MYDDVLVDVYANLAWKTRDVVEAKRAEAGVADARKSIQEFYDQISRQDCFAEVDVHQFAELSEAFRGQRRAKKRKGTELKKIHCYGHTTSTNTSCNLCQCSSEC